MAYDKASVVINSNNFSRTLSESFFESWISDQIASSGFVRMAAATTNGPAHGPRPASSTPAINSIPEEMRTCSILTIRVCFLRLPLKDHDLPEETLHG